MPIRIPTVVLYRLNLQQRRRQVVGVDALALVDAVVVVVADATDSVDDNTCDTPVRTLQVLPRQSVGPSHIYGV